MLFSRDKLRSCFERMYRNNYYRFWLFVFGILSLPLVLVYYLKQKRHDQYQTIKSQCEQELLQQGVYEECLKSAQVQTIKKQAYFGTKPSPQKDKEAEQREAKKRFAQLVTEKADSIAQKEGVKEASFQRAWLDLIEYNWFIGLSVVISFPMYLLMLLFQKRMSRYIFERLVMMVFVVLGVIFLVFTILYISPMKPAENLLGETATQEQIDNFNRIHGLDRPYLVRLVDTVKDIFTFDLGKTYQGNEDVARAITNKFPTTLHLSIWSILVALIIAIPAGIISAIKQYSSFDRIAMFLALLGLSIPNFWLGLIMILNFSINLKLLPATFVVGESISFLMPAIVLGTGMSASVARMTRSSILEVKGSDYIMTARAKGLSERKVVLKHILRNAMIPIVTVVGLQLGSLLGGAQVVEKVFNISGLGSYLVDKQFIPDVPIVLAGVVYIAIVISLANLVVDILYSFLDPRINS